MIDILLRAVSDCIDGLLTLSSLYVRAKHGAMCPPYPRNLSVTQLGDCDMSSSSTDALHSPEGVDQILKVSADVYEILMGK